MKGGTSPVSEADYAVDRFLREMLTAARPAYGWLSEETADSAGRLCRQPHLRRRPDRRHAGVPRRTLDLVRQHRGGRRRASARRRARLPGDRRDILRRAQAEAPGRTAGGLHVGAPREPALIGGPKPMLDAAMPHLHLRRPARAIRSLARLPHRHGGRRHARRHLHQAKCAGLGPGRRRPDPGGSRRAVAASRPACGRSTPPPIRATARWRQAAARCLRRWSRQSPRSRSAQLEKVLLTAILF